MKIITLLNLDIDYIVKLRAEMKTHRLKQFVSDLHNFVQYAVTNMVASYLWA